MELIQQLITQNVQTITEYSKEVIISQSREGFVKKKTNQKNDKGYFIWEDDKTKPCIILTYLDYKTPVDIKINKSDFQKHTGILPENHEKIRGRAFVLYEAKFLRI